MKSFLLSLILIVAFWGTTQAKNRDLSKNAKVYLLVVGPYNEDFASIWGHSGICIKDEANDIDKIYNFGAPAYGGHFMLNLLLGRLRFYLDDKFTLKSELNTYKIAKRDVILYEINMDYQEIQKLYQYLNNKLKEENKYYTYEFYKKNCTTYTLDALKYSINGQLVYPAEYTDLTYRKICDDKFQHFPWIDFMIKILAGKKNDEKLKLEDIFFVPKYLASNLEKTKIQSKYGEKPFFKNKKQVFDFPDYEQQYPFYSKPQFYLFVFLILEILIFAFSYYKHKIYLRFYDYLWFAVVAALSLFAFYTMVFTDYIVTKWNFNLLWLNPLFVLVFFLKGHRRQLTFKILSVFLIFTLLGFWMLPQTFYLQNLILAFILLLKTLKYGFLKNRFQPK